MFPARTPRLRSSFLVWLPLVCLAALGWPYLAAADGTSTAIQQLTAPKSVGDFEALQQQVQQVVAKVLPSVVAVRVGSSQGSGVVVSKDGYVLTAGHVVGEPNQQVTFIFPDGKSVKGKTLGRNVEADAGLMKITDAGEWPFVEMGKSADLAAGRWVLAVGHPLGYQPGRPPVVRVGRVLKNFDAMLRTDCTLVAGDSGGPLFDLDAKVVGINSRIGGPTTMNFHVAIDVFHESWDRLVKGESWQETIPGRDSGEVKAVLGPVACDAGRCVARIRSGDKDVALGTIVGPDGWILTKASELKEPVVCRLRDGRELKATIVGVDEEFDLAMLKVDAEGLPAIQWSKKGDPAVGQWVATLGLQEGPPLALGVISVPRRKIDPPSGVLGVAMEDSDQGPRVAKVLPDTPAQKAGVQEKDVILQVNGLATANQAEVIAAIKKFQPGETIKLSVKRGEQTLEISAKLAKIDTPGSKKRDMQNRSDVGISQRHDNFPTVLQHDTVVGPSDCGGPLVDLSGEVVGVNVARGGRTETYAVPSDVLLTLMYDLMSGRLRPKKPEGEAKPAAAAKPEGGAPAEEKKPAPESPPPAPPAPPAEEQKPPPESPAPPEPEKSPPPESPAPPGP